jgi:hypothetical protein
MFSILNLESANRAPIPCNVLPCAMDGIHVDVNTSIMHVASINVHDASHTCLPMVAAHLVAFALIW